MNLDADFSALVDIYDAPEPTKCEVIEEIDTCARSCASLGSRAPDRDATLEALTSFPQFTLLAAEIRLMIWNAALELDEQQPRVVNIFMKSHNPKRFFAPPSRLTVLNTKWLHGRNGIDSLLSVNYEARAMAQAYLASHPADEAEATLLWRPRRYQRWKGIYDLAAHLLKLRINPPRDVLFLNGLDVEPIYEDRVPTNVFLTPDPADPPLLPEGLTGPSLHDYLSMRGHTRYLGEVEHTFASTFGTVMMPVHGLIEERGARGLFEHPWRTTRDTDLRTPMDRTFIALVGHYRGRNLQMDDLEFIPDVEVGRIRREAWRKKAGWTSNANTRVASSVLHRDVLVMLAVWKEWGSRGGKANIWEQEIEVYQLRDLNNERVSERVRLRFARVKQEVLDRLTPEDVYIPG
jgi:hypothetical protein